MRFARAPRTRRQFIREVAAGIMVIESAPILAARLPQGTPAVSFFLDHPYWDATGLEAPYRPPRGSRSGQALAALSEMELRHAFGWF